MEGQRENEKAIKTKAKNLMKSFFEKILPQANPEFEEKYDLVRNWIVEFDEQGLALREIGLEKNGKVIVAAPYEGNCGFWLDTNMNYDDFKDFNGEIISRDEFEKYWENMRL